MAPGSSLWSIETVMQKIIACIAATRGDNMTSTRRRTVCVVVAVNAGPAYSRATYARGAVMSES
jgi:hypothetical protein